MNSILIIIEKVLKSIKKSDLNRVHLRQNENTTYDFLLNYAFNNMYFNVTENFFFAPP